MIDKFFPQIFEDIVMCNHFGYSGKKYEKHEICHQHGAKALIDDSVSHCVNSAKNGIIGIVYGDYR